MADRRPKSSSPSWEDARLRAERLSASVVEATRRGRDWAFAEADRLRTAAQAPPAAWPFGVRDAMEWIPEMGKDEHTRFLLAEVVHSAATRQWEALLAGDGELWPEAA